MWDEFKVTDQEWNDLLMPKFDNLVAFASWQLRRRNAQNNMIDTDIEDIIQDLRIAVLRAGVYYKRQRYIEECLAVADRCVRDRFVRRILNQLKHLWKERTKHGANKRKFGEHQELILHRLVQNCVPSDKRPDPKAPLVVDQKFMTYCKQITWNQQKSLGRKITRDRSIRSGCCSLSDYVYLAPDLED